MINLIKTNSETVLSNGRLLNVFDFYHDCFEFIVHVKHHRWNALLI